MKNSLALLLCMSALIAGGFSPQWENTRFQKDTKHGIYWLKPLGNSPVLYGEVAAKRGADFNKIKISVSKDRIVADVREAVVKPESFVDFSCRLPLDKISTKEPTLFSIEIHGEKGLVGDIGLNGQFRDGKHYWNTKPFILTDPEGKISYEKQLPENLKYCSLLVRMRTAAVYSFGKAEFRKSPGKNVNYDPGRNWIFNGGAEREWYATGINNLKNYTEKGEYATWNGHRYRYPLQAKIDREEKHSGNASFAFQVKHFQKTLSSESHNILHFNQVPFISGKPALFQFYMKTDAPGRKVMVRLHGGPGYGSYMWIIQPSAEWKKYRFFVPEFGTRTGWISGDFRNNIYHMISPRIEFLTPGSYWVDDASYFLAREGEYQNPDIAVSGTLNKNSSYYFPDETISTKLTIRARDPRKKSVRLHWALYDFFGRKQASSPIRTIPLKNGCAEENLVLTPPENLRGAWNWTISVDDVEHNYYLGVIDRPKKGNPRLGVNLSIVNPALAIAYLKDFRYSAVRIWDYNGKASGEYQIEPFSRHGFQVLYCIGRTHPHAELRHLFIRNRLPWLNALQRMAEKYKGMVNVYEIINEPNALAGRSKNPDPDFYEHISVKSNARIIHEAAVAIRRGDPNAKIAGPATCGTDVSWIADVLSEGAWKDLDIISEHPYHSLPEAQNYQGMLETIQKLKIKYKKNLELCSTERGLFMPTLPLDNRHNDLHRKSTAKLLRTMLLSYAGGSETFFDFLFATGSYAIQYTMVRQGNPGNDYLPLPAYSMYAARAMADRIENAPMVRQVKLGLLYRCYIFDHGSKRTAVIWKWSGTPEKISFKRKFDIYDFMGTKTTADSFELSEFPCYLESTLPLDSFAREIANADLRSETNRFQVSVNVRNSRQFSFDIRNITGKTIPAGTVRILNGVTEQAVRPCPAIPPEGKTEVLFNTRRPIGLTPQTLSAEIGGRKLEFQLKGITAAYLKKTPVLDGDLGEWKQIPPILLTADQNAFSYRPWNAEEKKSRAELRFAWNKDGFYMAATVWKKGFHPVDANGPTGTWRGDGLQIAMDPLKNALPGSGYQDDDFEYDTAMFQGKPLVNRQRGSLAIHDSLTKKLGPVDDVQSAIAVKPDHVIYELAFQPFAVSPFRLGAGNSMRISVIANMNDGKERIGYLQLTPGLGVVKKDPFQFIHLFLEPENKSKK